MFPSKNIAQISNLRKDPNSENNVSDNNELFLRNDLLKKGYVQSCFEFVATDNNFHRCKSLTVCRTRFKPGK